MYYTKTSIIFLFLILINQLNAQPEPCIESNPEMTPLCAEACIICDINGFNGRHDSDVAGEAPDDFCTFFVHNAQWIAFIAGSANLSVEIQVSNCDMGGGLEIAIYESLDCESFTLVSNCFGAQSAVSEGSSGIVTVNTPLTIGQYYYIVMDGQMGDNCDWTLNVIDGDTQVDPLTTSGNITGALDVCPGISTTYETEAEEGATIFDWTLNGQSVQGNGSNTTIDWTTNGTYELCVVASNACDEAPPSCQIIEVSSIPIQFLEEELCEGDCFTLNDTIIICDPDDYEFNFLTNMGCDSTIFLSLKVTPESSTNLDIVLCEGDSIFIEDTPFYQTGVFTEILDNYLGCDSTITVDIMTIICEIQGESDERPVACFGEATGEINFSIEDGTPPFSYSWEILGGIPSGTGTIENINESELISNLPIGTYLINISDNFGNELVIIQEVTQPSMITSEFAISDFNIFNLSCHSSNDGMLEIIPTGGLSPYSYQWSNGEQESIITDLAAGEYTVTVSDGNGCSIEDSIILNQPEPLSFDVAFTNPNCDGFDTGMIQVENILGGVPPYTFQFLGNEFIEEGFIQNLAEGSYTVAAQDANACEIDTTATITAPVIPVLDLGEDLTIDLGCPVGINASSNIFLNDVVWSDGLGLSCYDCPDPDANPSRDTEYWLTIISEDGCTASDSLTISVNKNRRVYIPNAFSPNADGTNDIFSVSGGKEALRLLNFRIYSRWGELLFEQKEMPINNPTMGWKGQFKGNEVLAGVYVYYVEVEFLDGVIINYSGDITVIY